MPPAEHGVAEEKHNFSAEAEEKNNFRATRTFGRMNDVVSLRNKMVSLRNETKLLERELERATEGERVKSARLQREETCAKMGDFVEAFKSENRLDFISTFYQDWTSLKFLN